VEGNFLPTQAWKDVSQVLEEYKLYFLKMRLTGRILCQKASSAVKTDTRLIMRWKPRNLSRFLAFLSPDIYVSRGAKAEGIFKMDNTALLTLNAFGYGALWYQPVYEFGSGRYYFQVCEQRRSTGFYSRYFRQAADQCDGTYGKMELEGTWDVDHIDFNGAIHQVKSTNLANLAGEKYVSCRRVWISVLKTRN
jgi:hypothetical protein